MEHSEDIDRTWKLVTLVQKKRKKKKKFFIPTCLFPVQCNLTEMIRKYFLSRVKSIYTVFICLRSFSHSAEHLHTKMFSSVAAFFFFFRKILCVRTAESHLM